MPQENQKVHLNMKPCLKACKDFEEIINNHRWDKKKDTSMIKMYSDDRKDMRKVLSLYKKGEWRAAYLSAKMMDTASREYIPEKIWDDITSA